MKLNIQRLKSFVLINTCFLVLPSYILHYYLQAEVNTLFAILGGGCLLIVLHENHWKFTRRILSLVLVLCLIGSVGTYFSGAFSQLFMAVCLSLNLIVASCGWSLFTKKSTLNYLTFLSLILVFGAIFAFLYALAGGQPLDTIDLFGRDSYFYLTTFTNAVTGNIIRSAGIFDEPGGLAMFLVIIVALNEAFGSNTKWSTILLFAGLVTGSFALFVVAISYLLYKGQQKKFTVIITVLVLVAGLILVNDRASVLAEEFFFQRIEIVDGRLAGDNRTHQVEAFFEIVDGEMTFKGQKASDKNYAEHDFSSNPFSIYYGYGIFIWIPYAALELWLLYCSFFYQFHLRFPALAMFMILLQRPYLYSLYWSMMICVVLVTIYRAQRNTGEEYA